MAQLSTVPFGLIVDDDAVVLIDTAQILEEAGFRTLTAMSADVALDVLRVHQDAVTVLFTDVHMPGSMNGFDLARTVARSWPEIAIMIASGEAQPTAGDLPAGATFIRKPFSAEVVHARLQELLPDGKKPEPLRQAL